MLFMGMAAGAMYMMLCNDCLRNVYAYFLGRLKCSCIRHVHDAFVCVCVGGGGGSFVLFSATEHV